MQLEYDLCRCGGQMNLNWRPCELNVAADKLTNDQFDSFDLCRRIKCRASEMPIAHLLELASFHDKMLEWEKRSGAQFDASQRGRKLPQRRSGDVSLAMEGEGHPDGPRLAGKAHLEHSWVSTAL